MEISVRCGCGRNLSVSSELAGKKIKCAQCGAVSLVPSIPGNDGLNNDGHTDFKPHIALIGTEGSGKTVLTTVLAKYLTDTGDEHLYLDPSNTMTMKYIENMWQTLKGGEWPPSTPPGELFTLEWTFSAGPDLKLPMRLIDSAGQDLRVLFGDDLQPDESRPEQIRQLLDYCRGASILIVLINLKDFVGEAQNERCLENQAVLKQAISHLNKYNPPKRIAFVFTQCDLYESVIREYGGLEVLLKKEMPYLYNAHVRGKAPGFFQVAAVRNTRVVVEDGVPRRIPSPNFSSEGLHDFVCWLAKQVREEAALYNEQKRLEEERGKAAASKKKQGKWMTGCGVIFGALLLIRGCAAVMQPPPPCYSCSGSGQFTCSKCGGEGAVMCFSCNGKSPTWRWDNCRTCGKSGYLICSACQKSGVVSCSKCKGTGKTK